MSAPNKASVDVIRNEIDIALARELFVFDGTRLLWRANRCRARAGQPVGFAHRHGYLRTVIKKRFVFVHRIIWALAYDESPPEFIDHINGDTSDNRLANLRAATPRLNAENYRHAFKTNVCGLLGVSPAYRGFRAEIQVDRRKVHLGTFSTPEEAYEAYLEGKRRLHAGCTL